MLVQTEGLQDIMNASSQGRPTRDHVACIGQGAGSVDAVDVPQEAGNGPAGEQAVTACGVHLYGPLTPQGFCCPADGPTRGDHVINDGDGFSRHIQIFGFVRDGVSINSGFFEVGKFATDLFSHARSSVNGPFVGGEDEIWVHLFFQVHG